MFNVQGAGEFKDEGKAARMNINKVGILAVKYQKKIIYSHPVIRLVRIWLLIKVGGHVLSVSIVVEGLGIQLIVGEVRKATLG
jgi:hypothetical protein